MIRWKSGLQGIGINLFCRPFQANKGSTDALRAWKHAQPRTPRVAQSHQVVGGEGEGELEVDLGQAAVLEFAHASDGLGPAETFLDALADALAHGVATVTGGASVNGRTSVPVVLGHMRD